MRHLLAALLLLAGLSALSPPACCDSQRLYSGPLGPMYTVQLALGDDGSAQLSLAETAHADNRATAVGRFKRHQDSVDIDVSEIRYSGNGAGFAQPGKGFVIAAPRKGVDGPVPQLVVEPGSHIRCLDQGYRLEILGPGGLHLFLKK